MKSTHIANPHRYSVFQILNASWNLLFHCAFNLTLAIQDWVTQEHAGSCRVTQGHARSRRAQMLYHWENLSSFLKTIYSGHLANEVPSWATVVWFSVAGSSSGHILTTALPQVPIYCCVDRWMEGIKKRATSMPRALKPSCPWALEPLNSWALNL